MKFPEDPFIVHGGCNCKAFRYKIQIPPYSERPQNPYWCNAATKQDIRIPMVAFCHCNDCRRATGGLIPAVLIAELSWVSVFVASKDTQHPEEGGKWITAKELLDYDDHDFNSFYLSFYRSSPGRRRWFCGRCGTNLGYNIDPGSIPAEWGWPRMLDIWLGTVDREDLDHEWMRPDTRVWCRQGIGWIKDFVKDGAGDIPEPAGLSSLVDKK